MGPGVEFQMANVYFVGPSYVTVSDQAGNWLPGVRDLSVPPVLTVSFPLYPPGSCFKLQCGGTLSGGFSCWCADEPRFASSDSPTPLPVFGPITGTEGVTMSLLVVSVLPVAAIVTTIICLRLSWAYFLRWLARRRAKRLEEKLEKLEGLASVIAAAEADELGVDAEALIVLTEAIRQSYLQKRPLKEVADELLAKYMEDADQFMKDAGLESLKGLDVGTVVVEDRKALQIKASWPTVLLAAYETHLQSLGQPAEHDREALETLHSVIHGVAETPLEPGFEGGGGLRLRPPMLLGESDQLVAQRPEIDVDRLPPIVARAAEKLVIDGNDNGMATLRSMLEEYMVLPVTIAGALMAEFAVRNVDSPPATEQQQVSLLQMLHAGRVLQEQPWGIRVREGDQKCTGSVCASLTARVLRSAGEAAAAQASAGAGSKLAGRR